MRIAKFRNMSKLVLTFILFALVTISFMYINTVDVFAQATGTCTVAEDYCRIRSLPSTGSGSEILDQVNTGEVLTLKGQTEPSSGDTEYAWYSITTSSGISGWIRSDLVTVSTGMNSGSNGKITPSDGVNMRSSYGLSSSVICAIPYGATVPISGSYRDTYGNIFYKVTYNGNTGYASAYYIDVISSGSGSGSGSGSSSGSESGTSGAVEKMSRSEFASYLTNKGFPSDYVSAMCDLHDEHPGWDFIPDNTGLSWNDAVNKQTSNISANLVGSGFSYYYKSINPKAFNYNGASFETSGNYYQLDTGYVGAGIQTTKYYMDPRNFLDETQVFQFLSNKFDASTQTKAKLSYLLAGSFMEDPIDDSGYTSYTDLIYDVGKETGVNPLVLASMIMTEVGRSTPSGSASGTVEGYEGYYNFFNVNAVAGNGNDAVTNGLIYAKEMGWNTRYKSILGGAENYANKFVNNNQYTLYLKRFNVMNGLSSVATHQYSTSVYSAAVEGSNLAKSYSSEKYITFSVPVYSSMPSSKCASANETNCEVYYYTPSSLSVDGYSISPAYKPYIKNYTLSVPYSTSSIVISASVNDSSEASVSGTGTKSLKVGSNTFTVTCTAANGAPSSNSYTLTVTRAAASTISTLSSLSVSGYSISPAFSSSVNTYSLSVPFTVTSVNIEATPSDTKATVSGTGEHDLDYGENQITVICKAESGATTSYTINIYRVPSDIEINRISGANRFETSIAAAETLKSVEGVEKFNTIVVACCDNFPDALSASALSCAADAPIIITNSAYENEALTYIEENLADGGNVYLVGGSSVVSGNLEQQLSADFNVTRLWGNNRYDTNLATLEKYKELVGSEAFSDGIMICSGSSYADSLSAAATGMAVMLIGGELTESQKSFITSEGISTFYICGGTGAVSSDLESEISKYGNVTRLGGKNRYETSSIIARRFASDNVSSISVARGQDFPDGLAAGPLCAKLGSPLFLVDSSNTDYASSFFTSGGYKSIYVFGGSGVLSESTIYDVVS